MPDNNVDQLRDREPTNGRAYFEQQRKEAVYDSIVASLPAEIGTDLIFEAISEIGSNWPSFDVILLSSFEVARDKKTDDAYVTVGKDLCKWLEYYIDKQAKKLAGIEDE